MIPLALAFARPPHRLLVDAPVAQALVEDLGRGGDLTTDLVIPEGTRATARLVARAGGTLAGLLAAESAFRQVDASLAFLPAASDGAGVRPGQLLAEIGGSARSILTAERVALNFVGHLSGVATATRRMVDIVSGTKARIVCTRKTTPGLRTLVKYAVRCGGGYNHRLGLDDAVLIKDNHIAMAGSIAAAVERARAGIGHMTRLEVEVDTLAQLEEALALQVDTILLDNMSPDQLRRAVAITDGRAVLEASGGISAETVREVATTGVDYISSGSITLSASNLDVALDF